ncbi:MAG: peptidoglycan DD-metalloendopeptidase family protein [Burkholderiales bacterium]
MRSFPLLISVLVVATASGCATVSTRPAPVSERTPPTRQPASAPAPVPPAAASKPVARPAEIKGEFYTVRPGDTLYSIALEHGLDYRELALWNGIESPGALRIGQQLRVTQPAGTAVAAPLRTPGGIEGRPLAGAALPPAAGASTPMAPPVQPGTVVSEPKAVRAPYSDQALTQLAKPQPAPTPQPALSQQPAPSAPRAEVRPEPRSESAGEPARGPDEVEWMWPVRGKVIGTFNDATNKGIAIAGKLGQPVYASAPGRVIFSGTGIRGFGKLIVIKHNNTYLSVYAHNSELAVKEGQNVTRGQKIAEMGNTDADQVKLHFEIRRFGKPVDPLRLLPAG